MMVKKTDTEQKILEAATRVFTEKGKAATSLQDIADEAGINRTLLHYYFRSKDKLFDAIFQELLIQIFPVIAGTLISDNPLMDKLERVTETYVDLLKDKPQLPFFILQEIAMNPDYLMQLIEEAGLDREMAVEFMNGQFSQIGIRNMDARHFMASFLGMLLFPFIARPLFMRIGFANDAKAYEAFLEERKKEVPGFIRLVVEASQSK